MQTRTQTTLYQKLAHLFIVGVLCTMALVVAGGAASQNMNIAVDSWDAIAETESGSGNG